MTQQAKETWHGIDAMLDAGQHLSLDGLVDGWLQGGDREARIRAVRALRFLGCERQGNALALRMIRQFPGDPEARMVSLRTALYGRTGAYGYWRLSERWPEPVVMKPAERAGLLSLRAQWHAALRDFELALADHDAALALCADDPWLWVERGYVLHQADRRREALAATEQALALVPGYRAALQFKAMLLLLEGDPDGARLLLEGAMTRCQCSGVALQLFEMQFDQARFAEALATLDVAERWMPRADAAMRHRLAARRADTLLRLGRLDEASQQAAVVKDPGGFYEGVVRRIAAGGEARRRQLPLELVAQHWMTCAPATLTALCRYWGHKAEHLEIAETICFDGTTEASERGWAQEQGLWAREFRLDWDTACRLIDAGIPFALSTRHSAGGHLQAVMGYDVLRQTLLIRDPSTPVHVEYQVEPLLEQNAASGPRALLILPPAELHRIQGIVLPEAESWDLYHQLQRALEKHERDRACAALQDLESLAPDSRLALLARRLLAIYDGDSAELLPRTEALLERYPQDGALQLSKVHSLIEVAGEAASERYLAALVAQPFPDPLVLERWAEQVSADARRLPEAQSALRRGLRRGATHGNLWRRAADLAWQEGSRELALDAYRWAACLMPADEGAARAFAQACVLQGQAERGLAFLAARVKASAYRTAGPVASACDQLDALSRQREADELMREALQARPDIAELAHIAAERCLRLREFAAARALLERAAQYRPASRMKLEALIDEAEGQYERALERLDQATVLEPLNLVLHRHALRLRSRLQGREAALVQLRNFASRYPAHLGLQSLVYEWMPDDAEPSWAFLTALMAHHPRSSWIRRERARHAIRLGQPNLALEEAEAACSLAPERPDVWEARALVLLRMQGYPAATAGWRHALTLNVNREPALRSWLGLAPGREALSAALDEVTQLFLQAPAPGDGLLVLQEMAVAGWEAPRMLAFLQTLHQQRPDIWQCHVALVRQQLACGQAEAAEQVLKDALQRFSGLPRLHWEQALVLQRLGRHEEAMAACRAALGQSPGWNPVVRLLVELLRDSQAEWTQVLETLDTALQAQPEDADLMALKAWALDRHGQPEAARATLKAALLLDPMLSWAWDLARRIYGEAGQRGAFYELVDAVVAGRPGDAWAWTLKARHAADDEQALVAVGRALTLEPCHVGAWQLRFECLARQQRFDDIEAHLAHLPWSGEAPVEIRAWAARCRWRRGEHAAACSELQALADVERLNGELWRELADWLDECGSNVGYLAAARHLASLMPAQAMGDGYLGHALYKSGQHLEAIEALRRALAREPGYVFAAQVLVQAAQASADHGTVLEALSAIWSHRASAPFAVQAIRAACALQDRGQALEWLDRLSALEEFDIEHSEQACQLLVDEGWSAELQSRQEALLGSDTAPPGLLLAWLERQRSAWRVLRRVRGLARQGKAGQALLRATLRWLHRRREPGRLRRFLRHCDSALRGNDLTWGDVSYVLLSLGLVADTVRWTRDWADRQDPPSWALGNRCVALGRSLGWHQLGPVVDAGLRRNPVDPDLRFWHLMALAMDGATGSLAEGLQRLHEWQAEDWMERPLKLLQAFVEIVKYSGSRDAIRAFQRATRQGPVNAEVLCIQNALQRRSCWTHTPWYRRWAWI